MPSNAPASKSELESSSSTNESEVEPTSAWIIFISPKLFLTFTSCKSSIKGTRTTTILHRTRLHYIAWLQMFHSESFSSIEMMLGVTRPVILLLMRYILSFGSFLSTTNSLCQFPCSATLSLSSFPTTGIPS